MDCLGQSSFETGYAPGMRQPHSSLVILFQLEHGEDPATVRPLRAEVPVHPLCWFLSKSKYALGMRKDQNSLQRLRAASGKGGMRPGMR